MPSLMQPFLLKSYSEIYRGTRFDGVPILPNARAKGGYTAENKKNAGRCWPEHTVFDRHSRTSLTPLYHYEISNRATTIYGGNRLRDLYFGNKNRDEIHPLERVSHCQTTSAIGQHASN